MQDSAVRTRSFRIGETFLCARANRRSFWHRSAIGASSISEIRVVTSVRFSFALFRVLSEIAIFLQPVWYKCSAMAEIDTALAANRDAVEQMIRAGERSGTA